MNSECKECKKCFANNSNLRKHIKKFHEQKLTELLPYKIKYVKKKFKCEVCGRNFDQEKHFRYHKNKHVSINNATKVNNSGNSGPNVILRTCPLCTFQSRLTVDFMDHFEQEHNIQLEIETYIFPDNESFEEWKSFIERDTNTRYIKKRKRFIVKSKSHTNITYFCNRSGYYISRGQGKRRLKTQGSNKIDGYCPASLTVTFYLNGKVLVKFLKTHVGHQCDISHLYLTSTDRQSIAEKIASNIPFSVILDEVRDSVQNKKLERIHLLTKKDLYNIENAYNINAMPIQYKDDEKDCIPRKLSSLKGLSFEEEKNEIKMKFLQLLDSVSSMEQLEIFNKAITKIAPTLAALVTQHNIVNSAISESSTVPDDEKINI